MATSPPSTPPADGPRRATLRARTPTNPVRPEVIDALDELERSLGDVARWEQLLTGKETGPEWQRPAAPATPRPRHLGPGHLAPAADDGDDDLEVDAVVSDLQDAIRELDDRIDEIRPEPRPVTFADPTTGSPALVAGYAAAHEPTQVPDRVPPPVEPVEVAPLLLQARTIEPGAGRRAVTIDDAEEVAKRRRNGRMLTATGLALLLGMGALFLLPDNEDDTPLDQQDVVTTTSFPVSTSELLPELPAFPAEEVTTLPTAPIDTTVTTRKPTTSTTRKATPAPATTQPPQPTSSLPTPGAPTTTTPPTTPPPDPTTTTTTAPPIDPAT